MSEYPNNPQVRSRVLAILAEFNITPTRSDTANWGIERWIRQATASEERTKRAEAYKAEAVRLAGARVRVPWYKCAGTIQYLRLRSPQSLAYERRHGLKGSPFEAQIRWDHGVNSSIVIDHLIFEEGEK